MGLMVPPRGRHLAREYEDYMKAYSVAMLPGKERANVSYGGKSKLHTRNCNW